MTMSTPPPRASFFLPTVYGASGTAKSKNVYGRHFAGRPGLLAGKFHLLPQLPPDGVAPMEEDEVVGVLRRKAVSLFGDDVSGVGENAFRRCRGRRYGQVDTRDLV